MCIILCWCLDWCLFTWCLDDCIGWCLSPKWICLLSNMYGGCFVCWNEEWSIWAALRSAAHQEVCLISIQLRGATTIPALLWELLKSRNLQGEKLSPTRATLMPHILRTNFMATRDESYITPHPCLLPLEENGWMIFVLTVLHDFRPETSKNDVYPDLLAWLWPTIDLKHISDYQACLKTLQ